LKLKSIQDIRRERKERKRPLAAVTSPTLTENKAKKLREYLLHFGVILLFVMAIVMTVVLLTKAVKEDTMLQKAGKVLEYKLDKALEEAERERSDGKR